MEARKTSASLAPVKGQDIHAHEQVLSHQHHVFASHQIPSEGTHFTKPPIQEGKGKWKALTHQLPGERQELHGHEQVLCGRRRIVQRQSAHVLGGRLVLSGKHDGQHEVALPLALPAAPDALPAAPDALLRVLLVVHVDLLQLGVDAVWKGKRKLDGDASLWKETLYLFLTCKITLRSC